MQVCLHQGSVTKQYKSTYIFRRPKLMLTFIAGWTYDLYRKALFDLIRNYSFKEWKVTLKHLIVALLNFGADERLIVDQKFYDEALKPARLRESSKKNRFSVSSLRTLLLGIHARG